MAVFNGRNYTIADFLPFNYTKIWDQFWNDVLVELGLRAAAVGGSLVATSSTNNVAIGTGTKTLTIETGKGFAVGTYVVAVDAANSANSITGPVTSHTPGTGALVIAVPSGGTTGSGTPASWTVGISGKTGQTGPVANYWGGTAGGTANALTATTGAGLSALTIGMLIGLKSGGTANNGPTTVAVDGQPPVAVRKNGAALTGGEIPANTDVWGEFDGTYLRLLSGGLPAASNASTVTGTATNEAVTPASLAAWVPGLTAASIVDTANDYILLSTPSGPRKILASAVGLGSGPARRYLRLRALTDSFATDNGTKFLLWREVKPFATVDASGSPVAVSSASASSAGAGNPASAAFDGDTGSGWGTSTSPATYQYLVMDFGTAVTIRSLSINASGSGGGSAYIASSMAVESSPNGTDWTLVATIYPANTPNTFQAFQHIQ